MFNFDDRKQCDWIVFIFKPKAGVVRSWVMPYEMAKLSANTPGQSRKNAWFRDLSWVKLNMQPLAAYENNWSLVESPNATQAGFNKTEV